MFDKSFFDAAAKHAPRLNEKIVEGLAYHDMPTIYGKIDTILRRAFNTSSCGVKFIGRRAVSPEEQFAEAVRPRNNKRLLELLPTDTHLTACQFKLGDRALKDRLLEIPFVEIGGILRIRGHYNTIMPTLVDPIMTITTSSNVDLRGVVVPVARTKIAFRRRPYSYKENGNHLNADVIWAKLYNDNKTSGEAKRYPQVFHYHLCRYGVTGAFKCFGIDTVAMGDPEEINEENFPVDKWVICESSGFYTTNRKIPECKVRLAFLREEYEGVRDIRSVIASFFFITDTFNGKVGFLDSAALRDVTTWKRLLMRFLWKDFSDVKELRQLDDHIKSIDNYVDPSVAREFNNYGYDIKNTMDLLSYMILNYNRIVATTDVASVEGKKLQVTDIGLYYLKTMVNRIVFELERKKDSSPEGLTVAAANKIFNGSARLRWSQDAILDGWVNHGTSVVSVDSTTDLLPLKTTNLIVSSSKIRGAPVSAERTDPAHKLHPNAVMAHSMLMVTKSAPSSRGRIQPFMNLGPNYEVLASPVMQAYIDEMGVLMGVSSGGNNET